MDWYPRNPQSYRNDTWGLTLAEHGAYSLLLDYYYLSETPLPDNDKALASIIGCSVEEWISVRENVTRYFTVSNGRLTHNKCDEVIESQLSKRKDGTNRVHKYRKRKDKNNVTRYTSVSNVPVTLPEERRGEEKKEEKESKIVVSQPSADHAMAISLWNDLALRCGLSKVQSISADRKKKLAARLVECGGIEGWKAVLEKIEASPGLIGKSNGRGHEGWRASFDFVLQPSSFIKIMEGNYDHWGKGSRKSLAQAAAAFLRKEKENGPGSEETSQRLLGSNDGNIKPAE